MAKSIKSTSPPSTQPTKSYRVIRDLQKANRMREAPARFANQPKMKGCRGKGITYERLVGRHILRRIEAGEFPCELVSGAWFEFADASGRGYCQVDHFLICPGFIILIECKLTQSDAAPDQMSKLYEPVLRLIYGCPVVCVQVFKNIRYHPEGSIQDIKDLIFKPRNGIWSWHYIG